MRILISIIVFFLCLNGRSQSIDTIFFNSKWEPVKESKAKYYRIIEKLSDDLFEVSEYNIKNNILMSGRYNSIDPLIENGSFTFYDKNTLKLKANGKYANGIMTGVWIYFDQYGDSILVNYDFELINNTDPGFTPSTFIHPTMPLFNGSENALEVFLEYINQNKIYPALPYLHNIEGRIIIKFSINPKGKVTDIEAVGSNDKDLEREALRIIASSPDWTPGHYGDKFTTIMLTVPVYFEKDK
jgi:TonB family protein